MGVQIKLYVFCYLRRLWIVFELYLCGSKLALNVKDEQK